MIWPNSFLRLSLKMSLDGRMIPFAPSPISKFARLYSWLVFVRSIYVVDILKFPETFRLKRVQFSFRGLCGLQCFQALNT